VIADMFDKNPLAVAGLAAAAGAVIAALLPNTRVENTVLGPYRNDLKEKAADAAASGIADLKQAADQKIGQVAQAFESEGFSPDGITKTVRDVANRATSVAERGLEALADSPSSQQQSAGSSGDR
jgi:hypothetical protein